MTEFSFDSYFSFVLMARSWVFQKSRKKLKLSPVMWFVKKTYFEFPLFLIERRVFKNFLSKIFRVIDVPTIWQSNREYFVNFNSVYTPRFSLVHANSYTFRAEVIYPRFTLFDSWRYRWYIRDIRINAQIYAYEFVNRSTLRNSFQPSIGKTKVNFEQPVM